MTNKAVKASTVGLDKNILVKQNNSIDLLLASTPTVLSATVHKINADTGTTGNFLATRDISVLLDVKPTAHGITVELPNGDK